MSEAKELYEKYINKYFHCSYENEKEILMSDCIQEQRREIINLEQQKAELLEFIEEIQDSHSIYTHEEFLAWSKKVDYYKLQKE